MAIVKPFQAIRPDRRYAKEIASLPYDVYNRDEARVVVEENPLSFLAIDRAETAFPKETDIYGPWVYEKAGQLLQEWLEKGYFVQDSGKGFYLYELTWRGRVQNGIVGVSSVDDYLNQVILKHENTREEKEQDRIRHIEGCQAQTGPIFLAYKNQNTLSELIGRIKEREADFDFTGEDGVRHRVFSVFEKNLINAIEEGFENVDKIYIADGHHRCASAVKVCLKRRGQENNYDKNAGFNYFLSVLFPQSELEILDYNRVIRDLNGLTEEEFLEKLQNNFDITEQESAYSPLNKGEFGMYLTDKWYALKFKHMELVESHPVDKLDVSILQNYCFEPILGIDDPRTDLRIDFSGGIRGLGELERRVHTDCKVAFSMKATSMDELFQVARAGLLMPPKSTWFEPKLRSGLFIHKI
ncbi:MAG: DUF1015 domain-containing protein [Lachnospiraceae bacterium]|nr:DUF1015 domain-containing protein [Lachnospiraceae bacterium]